jgi:ATP:ADP antiporter, AAA family
MSGTDHPFGTIRSSLWPIYSHELRKMVPMILMLFLICFNYTALRNMKDSIVITASGAEVLPFIKVWVMLPGAVILTLIFTKLSNIYSQEKVFYLMTSGFLIFYALFAFVIYPYREFFHPVESADYFQSLLPSGFKGMISMYRYWTFTLFYVAIELWSTIVMTVLFWGFANEITRLSEAPRFYSVLSIFSNFAVIVAGLTSLSVSQDGVFNPNIPFGQDAWEQTMMILVSLVIVSGVLIMLIFRWMNRSVLNHPSYDDLHQIKKETKEKGKLSFRESLSYVSNSKYLICIAILVVAYNFFINLVEVVWKDQLKNLVPLPSDYNNYINTLSTIQGVVSTVISLVLARMISKMGWTWTALITPVVMVVTSVGFFGILFFQDTLAPFFLSFLGMAPLAVAVFFGSAQNCLSKACKYSVFDATKEMAYIPLSHECKLKGKAAIDGVGSRLGKSGSSVIHQSLLMLFMTVAASAPYVAAILLGALVLWVIAIRSLGTQFGSLIEEKRGEAKEKALAKLEVQESAT